MTDMNVKRGGCTWPGTDPLYCAYHDTEWGVPEYDARALWEKLILDGFQAGLSWITILRKRESFRRAFKGFSPKAVAKFTDADVARLLADEGIVRHRGKIEGAIRNAKAFLEIEKTHPGGFSAFCWSYVGGKPTQNNFRTMKDVPAATPVSTALSKELKKRGFTFCGPTIVYAWMQACGLVNDHMTDCDCHSRIKRLGEKR